MFGDDQDSRHQSTPLCVQRGDEFRRVLHHDSARARRGGVDCARRRGRARVSTPREAERKHVERLLLRLHDVRQLHVARLIEAQVGRDDGRQVDVDHLEARVDFARDARAARRRSRASTRTSPAGGPRAPRASARSGRCRRRSPACRAARERLFALDSARSTRATTSGSSGASVSTSSARSAPIARRCAAVAARRQSPMVATSHLVGLAALLDAQRFFERDLVERVDAHLEPRRSRRRSRPASRGCGRCSPRRV